MFLFLIDYAARLLRPVSILSRVGDEGLSVIQSVYPDQASDAGDERDTMPVVGEEARRIVYHTGASESVLAVDLGTLLKAARAANGLIEFLPHVGDFVATDEPLFVLHGGATTVDDATLRTTVAFGPERTMEHDPLFALRIMVDIALKALSPAINDPTTAVLAIDQIHRFLRVVGRRRLGNDTIRDDSGRARVICRTPDWDDFVQMAFVEIRTCGAGNVQIARRQRAMLDNLIASLPPSRVPALEEERQRLDRTIQSLYAHPDDLALARVPDSQGLGTSSRPRGSAGPARRDSEE
jgi:uncharacterized membrane protein